MSILAAIDIDDSGALKITRAIDLFKQLGQQTKQTAQDVTESGQKASQATGQQVDAITRLANESRAAQAETLRQAQNTMQMASAFQAGTSATSTQTQAIGLLNERIQESSRLSDDLKLKSAGLYGAIKEGTSITGQQVSGIKEVTSALANSTAATLQNAESTGKLSVVAAAEIATFFLGAEAIKRYAEASFEVAARNEVLATDMSIVAKNAHESSVNFEEQVQKIRALGITTKDAREAVITFAQANLQLSDASKLARAAQDLATIAGMNSSVAFHTLTTAIEEQYPRLLRQFGIMVNMNQVYSDYATGLGKTVSALDANDKRQAMLNVVLEEAAKVSGAYESSMQNVGKAMLSTERFTEELENKFGQAFLPTMKVVVDMLNEALDVLAKMPKHFFDVAAGVSIFIGVLGMLVAMTKSLSAVTTALDGMGMKSILLADAVELMEGPLGAIILTLGALVAAYVTWSAWNTVSTQNLMENIAAAKAQSDSLGELMAGVDKTGKAMQDMVKQGMVPSTDQTAAFQKAVDALNLRFPGVIASFDAYTGIWKKNSAAVEENTTKLRDNIQAQIDAAGPGIAQKKKDLADLEAKLTAIQNMRQAQPGDDPILNIGRGSATSALYAGLSPAQLGQTAVETSKLIDGIKADIAQYQGLLDTLSPTKAAERELDVMHAITTSITAAKLNLDTVLAAAKSSRQELQTLSQAPATLQQGDENLAKLKTIQLAVTGAIEEITKKNQAYAKAVETAYEKMTDTGKTSGAEYEALSRALKTVTEGSDAYNEMLVKQKKVLTDFALAAPATVAKYQDLSHAMENLPAAEVAIKLKTLEQTSADTLKSLGQTNALLALAGTKGVHDYSMALDAAKPALTEFNKLTKDQQAQFPELAKAAQLLKDVKLEDTFTKWSDAAQKVEDRLGESLRGKFEQVRMASTSAAQKAAEDLIKIQEQQDATLAKQGDELYDRLAGMYENDTDKKILANDRWLRDFKAGIQRQQDAIQAGWDQEQRVIDDRRNNEVRQLNTEIDNAKRATAVKMEQLDAYEKFKEAYDAAQTDSDRASVLAAAKTESDARLDALRAEGVAVYNEEHAQAQRSLDTKKAEQTAFLASEQGMLSVAEQAHAATNVKILHDASYTYKELASLVGGLTDTTIKGLFDILDGTKTFKDLFIGIWQSIKTSIEKITSDLFTTIIRGFLGMGQSGQSGISGVTSGLAGLLGKPSSGGSNAMWQGPIQQPDYASGWQGPVQNASMMGSATTAGSAHAILAAYGTIMAGVGTAVVAEQIAEKYFGPGGRATAIGAISGAGAGALAGAQAGSIGGWWGAGIGAVAGTVYGVYQARKNQTLPDREAFLKDLGFDSLDKLREYIAGSTIGGVNQQSQADTLFNTAANVIGKHDVAGNTQWMKDVAATLDKITTSKAWDDLIKSAGSAAELDHQMQLVGLSMSKLKLAVDAGDVQAVTDQTAALNQALAEQKTRLEGLNTAASGLKEMTTGWLDHTNRGLTELMKNLSQAEKDMLQTAQDALPDGSTSTPLDLLLAAAKSGDGAVTPDTLEKIKNVTKEAQAEFSRMGVIATGTFAGILADTGSVVQAMNAISPSLDDMISGMDQLGLNADGAFNVLINLRKTITANQDVANSLDGITNVLTGLTKAGQLTQDEFDALGDSAAAQFKTLTDRGVDANSKMLLMQPTLQALWQAEHDFHFQTDDATQALIDQGVAAGVVGPNIQDVNHKILDVLLEISNQLRNVLPAAFQNVGDTTPKALFPAKQAAKDIYDQWVAASGAVDEYGRRVGMLYTGGGEPPPMTPKDPSQPAPPSGPVVSSLPIVPSFANEGFVPHPMLAMVGDYPGGEYILHKATVDALKAGRGLNSSAVVASASVDQAPQEIHVHNYMDGKEVAHIIFPHTPGEARRYGLTKGR